MGDIGRVAIKDMMAIAAKKGSGLLNFFSLYRDGSCHAIASGHDHLVAPGEKGT